MPRQSPMGLCSLLHQLGRGCERNGLLRQLRRRSGLVSLETQTTLRSISPGPWTKSAVYMYVYVCMYEYMYICVYVYIYTHSHAHIYTYTYIHVWRDNLQGSAKEKAGSETHSLHTVLIIRHGRQVMHMLCVLCARCLSVCALLQRHRT